jgi:secondary thiamine-phosphate synthase enzyme
MIELSVKTRRRVEFVDITAQLTRTIQEQGFQDGLCLVYVPHTTAGVTINENADPSVVEDIITALETIVPRTWHYRHSEGNADAHIKSSVVGSSLYLIVESQQLQLGTWQGVYFCEFDGPRQRRCFVKLLAG